MHYMFGLLDCFCNFEDFVISRFCTIQFYCNIKLAGLENTVHYIEELNRFVKSRFHSIILHTSPLSCIRRENTQSRIQEETPKNVKNNTVCVAFSSRIRTHSLRALSCQTASQFKIVKSQSINIFFVIIIKSTCSDTKTEGARDYLL